MSNGSTAAANALQKIGERTKTAYQETYNTLCDLTDSNFVSMAGGALIAVIVLALGIVFEIVLVLTTVFALPFAAAIMAGFRDLRKSGSKELNELIVNSMGEFFGAEFTAEDLPLTSGQNTVRDRARKIGLKFHNLLRDQFLLPTKDVVSDGLPKMKPDSTPAETFSGFAIDFGVFTALMGLIGEIESIGKLREFGEFGTQIQQNLSIGRLQRIAQQPLFKIGVATPLEWAMHRQLRPTLLKEQEIIAALHSGDVAPEDAYEEFARLGYSTPKINSLISQYKQRVSLIGTERLWRWGVFSRADAVIYLTKQGWPKDEAELALKDTELARMDAQEVKDLQLLRRHVVNGVLTEAQVTLALEAFHTTEEEKADWLRRALFERDLPRKFMTEANLVKAFEHGIIDVDQFDAENERAGYSRDDQSILLILALLALKKEKDAAVAKAARDAKKKAKPVPPPKPPKP